MFKCGGPQSLNVSEKISYVLSDNQKYLWRENERKYHNENTAYQIHYISRRETEWPMREGAYV